MVAFKKMWDDALAIISKDEIEDIEIIERYSNGFVVKVDDDNEFVAKQDFVDFWCNMLYFKEISQEEYLEDNKSKFKYVYAVIKNLPYINENCGVLKLKE